MWDTLFIILTFVCFAVGVLYVRACVRLKGERHDG
jgi:hypothetical protein